MKFKVGDKVKFVKKIIFHNVELGGIFRIIFISKDDSDVPYLAESKKGYKQWFKEEELQNAEYTYEDLKESPVGTKITFKDGIVLVKDNSQTFESECYTRDILDLKNLNSRILGKIIKIEEPKYETVYEAKEDILDEVEKRYLRNIIRPFKNKVKAISKRKGEKEDYIEIYMKREYETFDLPCFKKGTMYKGMKHNNEYTLEELGL